jgi:hypothetical protein
MMQRRSQGGGKMFLSDRADTFLDPKLAPADSTYAAGQDLPFQRWFKFKEAFSPQLVYGVIDALPSRPKVALDCFAGSGTTALSCQLAGIKSYSIEVNPLLQDIIESKLTPASAVIFVNAVQRVVRRARTSGASLAKLRKRLPPTFIEPGVKDRFIYSRSVAIAIESLRQAINEQTSPVDRRLLTVALASILIEVSNVRVDGKGRRYRQNWQSRKVTANDVFHAFYERTTEIAEDLAATTAQARADFRLLKGDCRVRLQDINEPIDMALFSPPYPNSFDYTDIYNVELWMLGYLDSSEQNRSLRQSTLRSHVQVQWPLGTPTIAASKKLARTHKLLDDARDELWSKAIPEMVTGYFEDLNAILKIIKPKLSATATVAMVIGNSQYADVVIKTPEILIELAGPLGYRVLNQTELRSMRTSHQQQRSEGLMESLLVLSNH